MKNVYKFNFSTEYLLEDMENCKCFQLMLKLNSDILLTTAEKDWIYQNTYNKRGIFKCAGYLFDFSSFMKKYIVRYNGLSTLYFTYAFDAEQIKRLEEEGVEIYSAEPL